MAGKVLEEKNDLFQPDYYGSSPPSNTPGLTSGTAMVERGGSWRIPGGILRVVYRCSASHLTIGTMVLGSTARHH
jgi:hypothetical protein